MSGKKLVIAIDGPAASGKSTTAKLVAAKLGYLHVDTGAMYRAVTWKVLKNGVDPQDHQRIEQLMSSTHVELVNENSSLKILLDGNDVTQQIRSEEVTRAVSAVSSFGCVRKAMVREQRLLGIGGGIVLEGRDIGTVVFPHADLKIFMRASIEERAKRRLEELRSTGISKELPMLKTEIEERDRLDSTRSESPLRRPDDAIDLDTSVLSIEEQVEFVVRHAKMMLEGTEDH